MGSKMMQLKDWLKTACVEIRLRRNLYKDHQRKLYVTYGWSTKEKAEYLDNYQSLYNLRREYRHKHIAYSELRGRTREQIEASYPYDGQSKYLRPDEGWITKLKSEYFCEPLKTMQQS